MISTERIIMMFWKKTKDYFRYGEEGGRSKKRTNLKEGIGYLNQKWPDT